MLEKKNIVIKVKYPSSGDTLAEKSASSSGVIKQWNYKRIGLVLGGVLLVLMSLRYFSGSDEKNSGVGRSAELAIPEQKSELKAQPEKFNNQATPPAKTNLDINKVVVRAKLTSEIEKNEPLGAIKLPLKIGKKETLWIYYFLELKGMKGQTVYHEWLLNGELVTRKKVNISADPWRTASKQVITYTTNNDWLVRLVDEAGNKLNEKTFNLELK